jgi:hypothetical protein
MLHRQNFFVHQKLSNLLTEKADYDKILRQIPDSDYYTRMNLEGKIKLIEEEIDLMTIEKNNQWYQLTGFVYGLIKLGYTEDALLNKSPVELILLSSKIREIETAIAEEQQRKQSTINTG